jgi:hypothetical protein
LRVYGKVRASGENYHSFNHIIDAYRSELDSKSAEANSLMVSA